MPTGFTFERALSLPFSAPHFKTFPWTFGAAYAGCYVALFLVVSLFGWRDLAEWIVYAESVPDNPGPDAVMQLFAGLFGRFLPMILIGTLGAWVLWAMFETASQRRYIWGKPFTLGFGADEARMMVVGLLWALMGLIIFIVPLFILMGGLFGILAADFASMNEDDIAMRVMGTVFGALGLMLLVFPVYVFLATRLAPCFGLTVKDKRIRFLDAWTVSRGRFWPILGAYVILAVGGGFVIQLAQGFGQLALMPVIMVTGAGAEPENLGALFASPGFLIPVALFVFFTMFLQGILQHAVGGPAALAARCDPRGGVDELSRIDAFS